MSKISMAAAENAAIEITKSIVADIKAISDEISQKVLSIAESKVPKEIMQCFKKYPGYIESSSSFYIHGVGIKKGYINVTKQVPRPSGEDFELTADEAKSIASLQNKKEDKEEQLKANRLEISKTILALGTYARVKEQFPEALPFLPTQNGNMGLMINVAPVRKTVNKLLKAL